jgi:hypothetical protein
MKKNIKIVFLGFNWEDLTNNKTIGSQEEVINYVNTNRLKVENENFFKYKERFWYNQPIPELEYLNNYNLNTLYNDGPINVCNILADNGVKVSKDVVRCLDEIYTDIRELQNKMLNKALLNFISNMIKGVELKSDNMDNVLSRGYYLNDDVISEAVYELDKSFCSMNIVSDIVYKKKHILDGINQAIKDLIITVQDLYPDYETEHEYHYEDYYEGCLDCEIYYIESEK